MSCGKTSTSFVAFNHVAVGIEALDRWIGFSDVALVSRAGVELNALHRATGGIDNLQPPSLPFIQIHGILGAQLRRSLQGCDHSSLDAGNLNALVVTDHGLAIGEVEIVALQA